MRIFFPKLIVVAALAAGVCWGCGPAGRGTLPSLIPVKGKVTYKGKPLTEGRITFLPDYGREAHGEIQPDGTFVLTTDKDGDGAVAGEHRVSITNLEKSLDKDRGMTKYASPNTSQVIAKIDAEHTEFTFNLQ